MTLRLFFWMSGFAALGACLTGRAALIQGANPAIACFGLAIGGLLGTLLFFGKTTPTFAGAMLGSFSGLQLFQCLQCDGSYLLMPFLGAGVGAVFGWVFKIIWEPAPPLTTIAPPRLESLTSAYQGSRPDSWQDDATSYPPFRIGL